MLETSMLVGPALVDVYFCYVFAIIEQYPVVVQVMQGVMHEVFVREDVNEIT